MTLTATIQIRQGRPVKLIVQKDNVIGSIHLFPTSSNKKMAVVPELGELRHGDQIPIQIGK